MSDEGPRKYAPDWYRAEPDYSYGNHWYLHQYLADKKDPLWWMNQKEYDPKTMFSQEDYCNYMFNRYSNGSRYDADHPSQLKNK